MQTQNKEKETPQAEKEFIIASDSQPQWPAGIIVSRKKRMMISDNYSYLPATVKSSG